MKRSATNMLKSFLEILSGRAAEEVVWIADLYYWMAGRQQDGTADPAWQSEDGYLQLCRQLGCMPYYWYAEFWAGDSVYDGVEFASTRRGRTTVHTWTTPVGTLTKESVFVPESCSTACTRHPVADERDLRTLLYIMKHRTLKPIDLDNYRRRMQRWAGHDGLPSLAMPRSPLPSLFCEWTGVENGSYLLFDHPDLVEEILHLMDEQEQPVLEAICRQRLPLVHFADNLTSENYAGLFDAHMAGAYQRRLERLHEAGVRVAVHLDGTVRGLLPRLAAVGFDAVEALTPQPVGDVSVSEMRALAGSESLVLWGGVPGAMFARPYGWPEMKEHVELTLEAWRGTPFVLGVADQIPPDGNIDFCRRIGELVRKWR